MSITDEGVKDPHYVSRSNCDGVPVGIYLRHSRSEEEPPDRNVGQLHSVYHQRLLTQLGVHGGPQVY